MEKIWKKPGNALKAVLRQKSHWKRLKMDLDWQKKSGELNLLQQHSLIEPGNGKISIARQCELLGIHRSGYYYQPNGEDPLNLEIMGLLDRQYIDTPFYGVLRMHQYILSLGYNVNIKRIRRLLRLMGIFAIYPKKELSMTDKEHKIYPYLLKGVEVIRPNQV
jgi:putative transposase